MLPGLIFLTLNLPENAVCEEHPNTTASYDQVKGQVSEHALLVGPMLNTD